MARVTSWTLTCTAPDAEAMRAIGEALGHAARAGDVIVATGALGAGKTTWTQGFAAGLGVEGDVTSPTYVVSTTYLAGPSSTTGVNLVHVDAYRLSSPDELRDVELDEWLADSVAVVEWGEGMVDELDATIFSLELNREEAASDSDDETFTGDGPRVVRLTGDIDSRRMAFEAALADAGVAYCAASSTAAAEQENVK